jgi:hypothetical protein
MLVKCEKYLFILSLIAIVTMLSAVAWANSTAANYDPCTGIKAITKVKPVTPPLAPRPITKVKPWRSFAPNFGALTGFSPLNWGPACCLPTPSRGQFVISPKVWFARIQGQARKGVEGSLGATFTATNVDFDDHLGFKKNGNVLWSIEALYQLRPRWGIRYSFMPLTMEATAIPATGFTFGGATFASGTMVHSKWDRYENRAGIVFNLSHTPSSEASVFADWLNIQDRLQISSVGLGAPVVMDDTKNMAVLGLEFARCLKNYRGNTLALDGKGGIAFLGDGIGYEARAALSYLIPIKTGRFGFVKAGYQYQQLKKDRPGRMFETTMDGPFLEMGLLF